MPLSDSDRSHDETTPDSFRSKALMALCGLALVVGTSTALIAPVWLGDSAPLVSGLMIGLGTTGIASASFSQMAASR